MSPDSYSMLICRRVIPISQGTKMPCPPFLIAFYYLCSHPTKLYGKETWMKRIGEKTTSGANGAAQILLKFYP